MSSGGHDPSASSSGAEANADPLIGKILDKRYKITAKLGEGGMGEVYVAEHQRISRRVALKLLRAEVLTNEEAVKRFEQEAMTASSIGHENIIRIEDSGKLEDGRIYLAMELLDGMPFNDLIEKHSPIDPDRLLDILIQTGHGLATAHNSGIVHRDMKPENIYITTRPDGRDLPKLLDFGIAKVSQGEGENHLTRTGTIFGTPFYMAPEQALGQQVDHRADVYAMGVIMFEVFCGVVPFQGESFMGILTQHITAEPRQPSVVAAEHGRQLPPGVEEVILKAMKKEPDERYQKMDDLVAELVNLRRQLAGPGMSTYMEAHSPPQSAMMPAASHPPHSGGFHPGSPTPMPVTRDEHSQPYAIPPQGPASGGHHAPHSGGHHAPPSGGHHHPGAGTAPPHSAPYAHAGASSVAMKPPKSKAGLIVVILLLLAGGGGGAAFFLLSGDKDKAGDEVAENNGTDTDNNGTDTDNNGTAVAGAADASAGEVANGGEADAGSAVAVSAGGTPDAGAVETTNNNGSDQTNSNDEAKMVTVLVNSRPQNAKVFNGSRRLGKTPLVLQVNPDEPMELTLKAKRRGDTTMVVDGTKSKVTVVLERKSGGNNNSSNNNSSNNNNSNNNTNNDPKPENPCKRNPNLPECMLE